jgi:hypothetical protein
MEARETPGMHKYGESKTTRVMMSTVRQVITVRDSQNFKPRDFCCTECTIVTVGICMAEKYDK